MIVLKSDRTLARPARLKICLQQILLRCLTQSCDVGDSEQLELFTEPEDASLDIIQSITTERVE